MDSVPSSSTLAAPSNSKHEANITFFKEVSDYLDQEPFPDPFSSSTEIERSLFALLCDIGVISLDGKTDEDLHAPDEERTSLVHLENVVSPGTVSFLLSFIPPTVVGAVSQTQSWSFRPSSTHQDKARLLDTLATLALHPALTSTVAQRFNTIFLDLVARWLDFVGYLGKDGFWNQAALESSKAIGKMKGKEVMHQMETSEGGDVNDRWDMIMGPVTMQRRVLLVFQAFGTLIQPMERLYPFMITFLRHPLLRYDPFDVLPPSLIGEAEGGEPDAVLQLSSFLLAFHRILDASPWLPASPLLAEWSLPPGLEKCLKSGRHQPMHLPLPESPENLDFDLSPEEMVGLPTAVKLLAWRIIRKWNGFFAERGENLRRKWIHPSLEAPAPPEGYLYGDVGAGSEFIDLEWELTGRATLAPGRGWTVVVKRRHRDAWLLPLLEQQRMENLTTQLKDASLTERQQERWSSIDQATFVRTILHSHDLSPFMVDVAGILVLREDSLPSSSFLNDSARSNPSPSLPLPPRSKRTDHRAEPYVEVPSNVRALRHTATYTSLRMPLLISSATGGVGKARLIEHLAEKLMFSPTDPSLHIEKVVTINLADRSLDAKSLLGSLVSSPTEPGKFVFQEGTLVRSLRQGKWLVLKDIDKATPGVLSVIAELVERLRSRIFGGSPGGSYGGSEEDGVGVRLPGPEGGRWVGAKEGFMLFATRSLQPQARDAPPTFHGSHYWTHYWFESPSPEEISTIIQGRFARLGSAIGGVLISIWTALMGANKHASPSSRTAFGGGSPREVGFRDLLRWCHRVQHLMPKDIVIQSIVSNPLLQDEIFLEARDIFLSPLSEASILSINPLDSANNDRFSVRVRILAEGLKLSKERVEWALRRRVPEVILPSGHEDLAMTTTARSDVRIGRVTLSAQPATTGDNRHAGQPYALTKPSLALLEKLAVAAQFGEPVLLVGETGTGKTAATGYLARLLGKELVALNLSNQTEASDLLGGYKPMDESELAQRAAVGITKRLIDLFGQTFNLERNADFVAALRKAGDRKRWKRLTGLWREASRRAFQQLTAKSGTQPVPGTSDPSGSSDRLESPAKRRRLAADESPMLKREWTDLMDDVASFEKRHVARSSSAKFEFTFVEGPLVKALRHGHWVLLDEVNLASPETLESLSTLFQTAHSSIVLTERGDLKPVPRHPDFRLFACMNPATDVGKRDLPPALRSRMTEIWVPSPDADQDALLAIIEGYISHCTVGDRGAVLDVAELYRAIKGLGDKAELADGSNHPPHFSIRTLTRALTFASDAASTFGIRRALVEGFTMAYTMSLNAKSETLVATLIQQYIVNRSKNPRSIMTSSPARPTGRSAGKFVQISQFWLSCGLEKPRDVAHYILTPSVQTKIVNIARAASSRRFPLLIQGPTSSGKTSIIEYLAARTGHRFVRINNHEHTDIQEYLGTYVSDPESGQLVFREGILVQALRRGDWLVLDELNLAPTDVLEALNRLLDDNRELLIPETQEVVKPHPEFMLFATQNPPGLYGGRKVLSRAFRNRFLELHFDDVPQSELETILCEREQIAPSYAKKIVAVFVELQKRRQSGRVFEQRQSFATLRDLFRWAGRSAVGYEQLASDGFMLLAERARRIEDRRTVKEVIEQAMKVSIDEGRLYDLESLPDHDIPPPPSGLVWTRAMRRLYVLIMAALKRNEPVLLVGDPGSGKTSICQVVAEGLGSTLRVINCHQNTETSDFLGGQRPIRGRAAFQADARHAAYEVTSALGNDTDPSSQESDDAALISRLEAATIRIQKTDPKSALLERLRDAVSRLRRAMAPFEWQDGPLVHAMRTGDIVLLDEISLTDDSVLERLNSVLESSRTLVLAERGGGSLAELQLQAHTNFQFLATMNPGGDYGKKELSPALRNRFTEIWVPAVDDREDLLQIISERSLDQDQQSFASRILDFAEWFDEATDTTAESGGHAVGLRDLLAWADFMGSAARLGAPQAFVHGALMTVVDGIGALPPTAGWSISRQDRLRTASLEKLEALSGVSLVNHTHTIVGDGAIQDNESSFSIGPFSVARGTWPSRSNAFSLAAPTVQMNALRVVRALQVAKPILLEGSPGVGKTSLVTALAAASSHRLCRINLSEQTDLMDLFGSDLPVPGGSRGEFAWRDAAFLTAMREGDWVLLDEMNLASQAILEGLNSCLDHRGSVYIPELDRTFIKHPDFRVFAAQNPLHQGSGRKGLPKSFLDRFSRVWMNELTPVDLVAICSSLYPATDPDFISRIVSFNFRVHEEASINTRFAQEGAPWEFNLRDIMRWLHLTTQNDALVPFHASPLEYVSMLYLQRFRNAKDRRHLALIYRDVFGETLDIDHRPWPSLSPLRASIGSALVRRHDICSASSGGPKIVFSNDLLLPLQDLAIAFERGWLAIVSGKKHTGKSSLVRYFSQLRGRKLLEFSMSSETDTSDLLGSFEQADQLTRLRALLLKLLDRCASCRDAELESARLSGLSVHMDRFRLLFSQLQEMPGQNDAALPLWVASLRMALVDLRTTYPNHDWLGLAEEIRATLDAPVQTSSFQWSDGILVQAMRDGSWLLLENANLCSPSVLDRLNSVFEPGGVLILGEKGPVDGILETIEPHPDFRLVLSLDPSQGELSRAMRNRGVELHLDSYSGGSLVAQSRRPPHAFPARQPIWVGQQDPALDRLRISLEILSPPPLPSLEDHTPIVKAWLRSTSPSQRGLALRLAGEIPSWGDRKFSRAAGTGQYVVLRERGIATQRRILAQRSLREVPLHFLSMQSTDLTLNPALWRFASVTSARNRDENPRLFTLSVDALTTLATCMTANPSFRRVHLSKTHSQLSALEQSHLATVKHVPTPVSPIVKELYPLAASVVEVVRSLASPDGVESETQLALAPKIADVLQEFEYLCRSPDVDTSSLQVILSILEDHLAAAPAEATSAALHHMKALRTVMSMKESSSMTKLWSVFLPVLWRSRELREILQRLSRYLEDDLLEIPFDLACLALEVMGSMELKAAHPDQNIGSLIDIALSLEQSLSRLLRPEKQMPPPILSYALQLEDYLFDSTYLHDFVMSLSTTGFVEIPTSLHVAAVTSRNLCSVLPIQHLVLIQESEGSDVLSHSAAANEALLNWSDRTAISLCQARPHALTHSSIELLPALWEHESLLELGQLDEARRSIEHLRDTAFAASPASISSSIDETRMLAVHVLAQIVSAMTDHHHSDPGLSQSSGLSYGDLASLMSRLDQSRIQEVNNTATSLLEKSIGLLAQSAISDRSQPLGEALVLIGRALWSLYVPPFPYDPAIAAQAYKSYLQRLEGHLRGQVQAIARLVVHFTGTTRSAGADWVLEKLDAVRDELRGQQPTDIDRQSDPTSLNAFFREVHQCGAIIQAGSQLDQFIERLGNDQAQFSQHRAESILETTATAISRLERAYPAFSDLLGPIKLAVRLVQIGVALAVENGRTRERTQSPIVAAVTAYPLRGGTLSYLKAQRPMPDEAGPETILYGAASISLWWQPSSPDPRGVTEFKQALHDLFALWDADRARAAEAEEAQNALYKLPDVDDDEEERKEFEAMFPSFGEEDSAVETDPPAHDSTMSIADSSLTWKMHTLLFDSDRSSANIEVELRSWLTDLSRRIVCKQAPQNRPTSSAYERHSSVAFTLSGLTTLHSSLLGHSPTRGVPAQPDFYGDANVEETSRAIAPLRGLEARLRSLIALWPEQMILQDLLTRCQGVLGLPAYVPVARLLASLEALLAAMEDWEQYASREHSLVADKDQITNLIISWRRLELASWSSLVDRQYEAFVEPLADWWFRFFETTVAGRPTEGVDEALYYGNLVEVIDTFMRTSPTGQYEERLRLVNVFARFAEVDSNEGADPVIRTVSAILSNIHHFYRQFLVSVRHFLGEKRKIVDKQVSDLIRLASWKDVNVFALRQSSQRSHRQLHKCIRKVRESWQQPVADLLKPTYVMDDPVAGDKAEVNINSSGRAPLCSAVSFPIGVGSPTPTHADSKIKPLREVGATLMRLYRVINEQLFPFVHRQRFRGVDEFASLVAESVAAFQAETAAASSADSADLSKNLTVRKRRAWADLLKELRRTGLSPFPRADMVNNLRDSAYVYSQSFLDPNSLQAPNHRLLDSSDDLAKADVYYFRCLARLPALRQADAAHHGDVSSRDIQRAVGSVESGLHYALGDRQRIFSAVASLQKMVFSLNRLVTLVDSAPEADLVHLESPRKAFDVLVKRVHAVLESVREAVADARSHVEGVRDPQPKREFGELEASLKPSFDILEQDERSIKKKLFDFGPSDGHVLSRAEADFVKEVESHLREAIASVRSADERKGPFRYLLRPLADWLEEYVEQSGHEPTIEGPRVVPTAEQAKDNIVGSILVVVQDIAAYVASSTEASIDCESDFLPDFALKDYAAMHKTIVAKLRPDEVLARVNDFFGAYRQSLAGGGASGDADRFRILLGQVHPFLQNYSCLLRDHLEGYVRWHKALMKLVYIIMTTVSTIAEKGFCRPVDEEEDGEGAQADGKLTDGTGMGAGQGQTDVTDQIEGEEQVEGLRGEEEEEKQKGDEQATKDSKAMEMSQDIEGEMEDVEEDEEGKDEESAEEGEEQDLDEQLGDVDPLDPTAVDEKFWGDEEEKDPEDPSKQDDATTKDIGGQSEAEMVAKEDGKGREEPKADKEKAKETEEAPQEEQAPPSGDQGEELDEGQPEGEEGEEEVEQADRAGIDMDEAVKEGENLDLPEDMQLDGAEDKGDEDEPFDDLDLPEESKDADAMDEVREEEAEGTEKPEEGERLEMDEMAEGEEENDQEDETVIAGDEGAEGGGDQLDSVRGAGGEEGEDKGQEEDAAKESKVSEEQVEKEARQAGEAGKGGDQKEMGDAGQGNVPPSEDVATEEQRTDQSTAVSKDQSNAQMQQRATANTQRQLGDSIKDWRRRLEAIQDAMDKEATADAQQRPEAAREGVEEEKSNEVEYLQEGRDEDEDVDMQALGPATEDQVQRLDQLHLRDEEMIDDTGAPDQDIESGDRPQMQPTLPELDLPADAKVDVEKAVSGQQIVGRDGDREAIDVDETLDVENAPTVERMEEEKTSGGDEAEIVVEEGADEEGAFDPEAVWRQYESDTRTLSYNLTEQLRLILEPTLATRLKGDYRTGKRLNMRKVIPYIASEYTKDKIWLRRTRPSQREYQVLLAIDDSKSMADSRSVRLARQSLALISRSLARLEVGDVSVAKFGQSVDIIHPFGSGPITDQVGSKLIREFGFDQRGTDVRLLVEKGLEEFGRAKDERRMARSSLASEELWQLGIIISDGMCQDHEGLRALLRRASEQRVLFVFIVIDSLHQRDPTTASTTATASTSTSASTSATAASTATSTANPNSILAMSSVSYVRGPNGQMELKMERYLDSFPFEYFVVLRSVEALPDVLGSTLTQFFERVSGDR